MAASSQSSSRPSAASSTQSLKRSHPSPSASLPIDTLVNHLLAAKRSLSSMTLVLHGHNLANSARTAHESHTILASNVAFLHAALLDQISLLSRLRGSLQHTYTWADRDFRRLVRQMDEQNAELGGTMDMLNATAVQKELRPEGSEEKTLGDFLDGEKVGALQMGLKKSVDELQGIQQSFDSDLLRFDDDVRALKKILAEVPSLDAVEEDEANMAERLASLIEHSSHMGQLLASLTKHFDMCVTAIRTTEGAAALARRKAAEVTQSQGPDGVSISGVIAEQEENVSDLEPKTAKDRAEMLKVVVQDAAEVDDVVAEIQDRLADMENESSALAEYTRTSNAAYLSVLSAFALLSSIEERIETYIASETDFLHRWDLEREIVHNNLEEMKSLRLFYERYSGAYNSLLLEVERRRAVDERVKGIWKKAQDSVDRILREDEEMREGFRADVGEYIPTDLWDGLGERVRRWKVVPAEDDQEEHQ